MKKKKKKTEQKKEILEKNQSSMGWKRLIFEYKWFTSAVMLDVLSFIHPAKKTSSKEQRRRKKKINNCDSVKGSNGRNEFLRISNMSHM